MGQGCQVRGDEGGVKRAQISGGCTMKRRTFLHLAASAAALPTVSRIAKAQTWPSGPIRIIVPFPPGGSTDVIARLSQAGLQQRLGTTVIIENRGGASGIIGAAAVAKAAPDGNTWLLDFDNHGANQFVVPNIPYDTERDFSPVQLVGTAPYVLSTPTSRPFKTLADVIAAAKRKPDTLTVSNPSAGTVGHLAAVMLADRAGIKLVHVPYRGVAPQMTDLVGGHVDLAIASSAATLPQLQSGMIRLIAQTGAIRVPGLPDVPTVAESGLDGFEVRAWWGLFAPARTPSDVIKRFGDAFAGSLRDEQIAKQLVETQQVAMALNGPNELSQFLAVQMNKWAVIVEKYGIKAE
jgi:tripartite-type tricarboxylate transporter receptor subunit TctC